MYEDCMDVGTGDSVSAGSKICFNNTRYFKIGETIHRLSLSTLLHLYGLIRAVQPAIEFNHGRFFLKIILAIPRQCRIVKSVFCLLQNCLFRLPV